MIEVEVRGKIENFEKTLEEFRKKARFVEEKDRFTMLFVRKEHSLEHALKRETIKDELIDLKVRITNKQPEIVLKYGKVKGSEGRKEILIPIKREDFDKAVELFKLLEWHKGVIMDTKTFVFIYKDVEFAIVHNRYIDYFEAEKIVHEKEDANKILEEIKEICKDFDLKPVEEKEFFDLLDMLNNQKERLFDLTKQDLDEIKDKWKEYF